MPGPAVAIATLFVMMHLMLVAACTRTAPNIAISVLVPLTKAMPQRDLLHDPCRMHSLSVMDSPQGIAC